MIKCSLHVKYFRCTRASGTEKRIKHGRQECEKDQGPCLQSARTHQTQEQMDQENDSMGYRDRRHRTRHPGHHRECF